MFDHEFVSTLFRLSLALFAGGIVGIERSYHGRSAGFREHTLVCVSGCLLMLLAEFQPTHVGGIDHPGIFLDPTRMAQGVMTGIGFLGAGAIIKDGPAIRGLTTAASIWMISAIGIMIGMGYFVAAAASTFATLNINYVFRLIESRISTENYAHLQIRFSRDDVISDTALQALITNLGYSVSGITYALIGEGKLFEYQMTVTTILKDRFHPLSQTLLAMPEVKEFSISPRGE